MYLGHVLRMPNYRLPYTMLHADIESGKRLPGGQEISYRACIRKYLEFFSISVGTGIFGSGYAEVAKSS